MTQADTVVHVRALLTAAQRIGRIYEPLKRGAQGERFNLFHLLGVGHLEVSTHSSLLRDLLDPEGSHGQGDVFLQRFVSVMGLPPLPPGKVKVSAEVGIGTVTEDSGGRLDLVVNCGVQPALLIENKIYAGEQNRWVTRYLNYAPGASLIYLTLDGRSPENLTEGERPSNLLCRSYAVHVIEWIKQCRKEAVSAPTVRESLSQYLHLLQELTQQSPQTPMNADLIKAATDSREALEAFFALRQTESELRRTLIGRLQARLEEEATKRNLKFKGTTNNDYGWKGAGFEFQPTQPGALPVQIRFEFDKGNYQDFAFGFADGGKLPVEIRDRLRDEFAKRFHSPKQSTTWPAWIYWEAYQNWAAGGPFVAIQYGQFIEDAMTIVDQLVEVLRSVGPTAETSTQTVATP